MTKTAAELSEMRAAYEAAEAAGDTQLADRLYVEFADARRAAKETDSEVRDMWTQKPNGLFGQLID